MLLMDSASTFSLFELDDYVVEPLPKYVEKRGYIYVIRDKVFPDFIKIGRTSNISKRLMAYNTDKPYPTTELVCISEMFANVIEAEGKILERMYKETNPTTFKKEWFKVEYSQLCEDLIKEAEVTFPLY